MIQLFPRLASHPGIASKLVALQGEKWLFSLLHPSRESGRARKIRQLSLRVTDLCNLRCATCGQWGEGGFMHGQDLKALKKQEIPVSRHVEILADLVRHGHRPFVYLWGGEPMMYPGAMDLIESSAGLGLPTSIATNSHKIAQHAERLVRAPLFLLQISIDGPSADLHNRIRPSVGGTDNFSEIEAALDAVHRRRAEQGKNLPLIASLTTLSKENEHALLDIYEAFRDRVDLFVFYLSWWIDEARARAHDQEFARRFGAVPKKHWGWVSNLKPRNYEALDRQLAELLKRAGGRKAPPVILIPPVTGEGELRRYYTDHANCFGFDECISIYQAAEVNSNGDVSPCRDYHDYVVGNIRESTLTELWNHENYRRFRCSLATEGLMPVCSRCCGLMGY